MKLTLILFLSVVTLVACSIPKAFTKKSDENCICKEKQCTDVSCEEKACLCLIKALKQLLANKDLKYPKKWLEFYLQILQERCLCLSRCQNVCAPSEQTACTKHAFDVFNCKYQAWLAGIAGDKGYEDFIKDINRILRECLKKDCKPVCSGNGDCKATDIPPKDCGCTRHCAVSSLEDFSESLENEDASYAVAEYSWHIGTYYDAYLKCEENKNPKACHGAIKEEIEEQTEKLYQKLIAALGACSGINANTVVTQIVLNCAFKPGKK